MASVSFPTASWAWHAGSTEEVALFWICCCMNVCFIFSFLTLLRTEAPYGRYNQSGQGAERGVVMRLLTSCNMDAKVAWFLQEIPTVIAAAVCWYCGSDDCKASLGNCLVLLCFVFHYVNRAIIYPMRMKGSKPTPLPVMLMALLFCALNGYVQCRSLTRLTIVPLSSWTTWLGITIWALGFYINYDADHILRNLRKPGETGYKIPRGGMFEYISGANFFGEIVEWSGFAIATGFSLPGVTFAFCTASNIGPRALSHHEWYLKKFKDEYPKERKALFPFLL